MAPNRRSREKKLADRTRHQPGKNSGLRARIDLERELTEASRRFVEELPPRTREEVAPRLDTDRDATFLILYEDVTGKDLRVDDPEFIVEVHPREQPQQQETEEAPVGEKSEQRIVRPNTQSETYGQMALDLLMSLNGEHVTVAEMGALLETEVDKFSPSISVAYLNMDNGWEFIHRSEGRPLAYWFDPMTRRNTVVRAVKPAKSMTKKVKTGTVVPAGTLLEVVGVASSGLVVKMEDGRLYRVVLSEL